MRLSVSPVRRPVIILAMALLLWSCSDERGGQVPTGTPGGGIRAGVADVGGYMLAYRCQGTGSPTVLLEAGLDSGGSSAWQGIIDDVADLGVRACTYDRAGTGTSDPRPERPEAPTATDQADELHRLMAAATIEPPFVLVPHSYGGLVARMFADRSPDEVAGFVFEDVSTAWEIDLWPRFDDSPWIDGGQKVDIEATEGQVLDAAGLGDRPAFVVSQDTYDEEGIPSWAAPIFARQQARLAALGSDVVHVRADGVGHFIHEDRPELMLVAIEGVVDAVRDDTPLPACEELVDPDLGSCV